MTEDTFAAQLAKRLADGTGQMVVLDEGDTARFVIAVADNGTRQGMSIPQSGAALVAVRDMLNTIIERNTGPERAAKQPPSYQPHTHPALLMGNWNGGPVKALLVDEGDSVTLSTTLEIQGLTMETEVRLSPGDVTAMQKRLADIRAYRGW